MYMYILHCSNGGGCAVVTWLAYWTTNREIGYSNHDRNLVLDFCLTCTT